MTDHIVVFDGNERLTGRTVAVQVEEATAYTLFGTVITREGMVGGESCGSGDEPSPPKAGRVSLRLI